MQDNPQDIIIGIYKQVVDWEHLCMTRPERRRHLWLLGKQDMGKSEAVRFMAEQDMEKDHGFTFIDPHGKDVQALLQTTPPEMSKHVIYYAPGREQKFPFAWNLLPRVPQRLRSELALRLTSTFAHIWENGWGPSSDQLARNAFSAQLDAPKGSLMGAYNMILSKPESAKYREYVSQYIQDPLVKTFWEDFNYATPREQRDQSRPLRNKLENFLTPAIRNTFGQFESRLDLRWVIRSKKKLLVNLSPGVLSDESANLIGSLLVTALQFAALQEYEEAMDDSGDMNNQRDSMEGLVDHFVYLNDFHKYATPQTLINGLDQAQHHRLNFILSNPHTAQLHDRVHFDKVSKSLLNSVGTICVFRTGGPDAEIIRREFSSLKYDVIGDFTEIEVNEFLIKIQQGSRISEPFPAYVISPKEPRTDRYRQGIIKRCREQYCRPRQEVERELQEFANKWLLKKNTKITVEGKAKTRHKKDGTQKSMGRMEMPPDAHRLAIAETKYRKPQAPADPSNTESHSMDSELSP